jgi:hypothetical protein
VAIVSTDSVEWDRSENRFDLFGIGRAVPDAQWADPGAALPIDAHWRRSDIEPTPGEQRLVYLQQLVFPDSGWITFQPPLAAVNGWEDFPEAIPLSGYAFCRLQAAPAPGWARVEVEDYVGVPQMQARFDPRPLAELETRRGGRGLLTVFGEWEHLHVSEEFASHWLLARREPSSVRVLAAGQYCEFDPPETAWIGHGLLAPEAWDQVCGNVRHGCSVHRVPPT